jgi:1,2-diacylglycerol 3-alpha-glucosyltransferase
MLQESLNKLGHEVYVFTTTDPQASGHEENIYRVPSVPAISKKRLGICLGSGLMETIKNLKLDAIHTHTEFSLGLLGRKAARRYGIALIHTMHTIYEDYTHYISQSERLRPITKEAVRRLCASFCNSAGRVIVPTLKVEALLQSYVVYRDISIISTGINLEKFSDRMVEQSRLRALRGEMGIAENDKVIISIGRLSREKKIDEVLYGLKDYLPLHSNVRFLIVGGGPARIELEKTAAELGIRNQVIFAGERPWDEIANFYHLGDVFVSASQSETQGLTYIEALASGVPVVAKADKCLQDVLYNGINGYVFDDAQGMASALDHVLYNSDTARLRLQSQLSTGKFAADSFAKAVLSAYCDVNGMSLEIIRNTAANTLQSA